MEKGKSSTKELTNRETMTFRLPNELNAYTKEKAEKIGVSQNAFLLIMIDMGVKVYETNYYVNPRQ